MLSIIIPIYNAEKTLPRTLKSLNHIHTNDQNNTEIILIDDGSKDKSFSILKKYQKSKVKFRVLLYRQNKNINPGLARNQGINIASGQWIFFLDADDEININPWIWIKKYPQENTLIFPVKIDHHSSHSKIKSVPPSLFNQSYMDFLSADNPLTVSSVIFKKSLISQPFIPNYYPLEDWLFWWTNSNIFKKFKVCPEPIATIHIHSNNMTKQQYLMGKYRQKVSQWVLKNLKLSTKQKNNLLIQNEIGKIQTGSFPNLLILFHFPCNLILYSKFLVYLFFYKSFLKKKLFPHSF